MQISTSTKRLLVGLFTLILGFAFNAQVLYAQEEGYEYADCGFIVDNSDGEPCFSEVGTWKQSKAGFPQGPDGSSLYAANTSLFSIFNMVKWTPDYEKLNGAMEVFVSIPPITQGNAWSDPEEEIEEQEYELSQQVIYMVGDSTGVTFVPINQSEKSGNELVSLGTFTFDGTAAWVMYFGFFASSGYYVADMACFGAENCPANLDLTPPKIEDVIAFAYKGKFYIQAKITDEGTGVAEAFVTFNGTDYPMSSSGDIYSAIIPYTAGTDLDYKIVARDGVGNEAQWDPPRGYMTRGSGFWLGNMSYAEYLLAKFSLRKATGGLSSCSPFCGDPVNTQNGNLYEHIPLAQLSGRPEIALNLSYNSQGGGLGIFGESWTYSYNAHITHMDNGLFQGVFVQYPDGSSAMFSGPDFTPEPGNYDTLERDGDGFKITKKDQTVYYFDSFGDLTRLEDANGNGLTFTYAEQTEFINFSKLTSIKADGGREVTLDYNANGLVTQINLPEGKTPGLEYNETDDLVTIVNGNGGRTVFEYENHSITKKISPEGHAYYTNTYDAQRRVTKQVAGQTWTQEMMYGDNQTTVIDKNGTLFTYNFSDDGLMISNTDEAGYSRTFEHTADRQVKAEVDGEGKRYEYQYDDRGNQIEQKDPLGYVVRREFDPTFNKPTYERNEKGAETRWAYDGKGNLLNMTNADGKIATFGYNEYGQLTESRDFNGNPTTYAYTPAGDLTTVTDALGHVTTLMYDGLGRMVSRYNPKDAGYFYLYDQNDNVLEIVGPLGYHVKFQYDRNNRLIAQTDSNGGVVRFEYDQSENLMAQINPLGFRSELVYGLMNERIKAIDPEGRVTQFGYTPRYEIAEVRAAAGTSAEALTTSEYNGLKLPVRMIDAEGRVTEMVYDDLYRLAQLIQDANGLKITTTYAYNPTGQIVTETDPNGNSTTYELDTLDRIISKTDAEGQVTRFEYDAQGNLTQKINPRGFATLYAYDALNRLVKATDALGGVSEFAYDANGNLISAKNPNKITTAYQYDALDRMIAKIENSVPVGPAAGDANVTTAYTYDRNGNLVTLTNPRSYATTFAYDAANRTVSITDALGHSYAYTYDKVDNVIRSTDRNGNATTKQYDELNRLVQLLNAENHVARYGYDKVGNLTALTDPRNATTQFQYDGVNRRTAKIDALNGVERYAYDPAGNLLAQTDANGHAQRYTYDKVARLVESANAEGHAATLKYDANGNPVELTDRKGHVTVLTFDELDRLARKLDAEQGQWRYAYDPVGNLLIETDANGHETRYAFDALNRRLTRTDAEGYVTTLSYDPNGNRVSLTDGNGHVTTFSVDELDRLASATNAEKETTAYRYDAEGNRTDLIEADGLVTRYNYDRIYRLIAVVQNFRPGQEPAADVNVDTRYAYDPNGNLLEILNPNAAATRFEYDPLNRQIQEIDALGHVWTFAYDPAGNRTRRTDANGHDTAYSYYPDDQVQQISYYDGSAVSYTYDPHNNRIGMTDRLGRSAWAYDRLNRTTAVQDALGRNLAYSYDAVGNRTGLTYPDGRVVNFGYYRNDWLQTLTDPEQGLIAYDRDGVGLTTQITNPNETVTDLSYDQVNRMLAIVNQGKKVNSAFRYTYNDVGHRTQAQAEYAWRSKGTLTTDYSYDGLRRLTKSQDTDGAWNTYAYDRAGNRLSYATNDDGATNNPKDALEQSFTYNAINQVLAMTETGKRTQTTTFEYDANGNRIQKEWPGPQGPQVQGTQYSYDPENRLSAVLNYQDNRSAKQSLRQSEALKNGGSGASAATTTLHSFIERDLTTLDYDGLGRRLVKTHDNKAAGGGAKRVEFVFDGLDPIADYDMWNPQYTNYYRGDGNRIAMRQNFPTGTQGQRYWYHYDALGSVVGLTKQQGQSDHNYPYADYGLLEPQTGNFTAPHNAYTYTGQMWDANMSVYEFYARVYDPQTGVWLQQDVYRGKLSESMSLMRYMYVYNNPTTFIDYYGLSTVVFSRNDNTLTLYDNEGNQVGQYSAANNVITGKVIWPNGTYNYSYYKAHRDENELHGRFGTRGIFIFDVPGKSGMGIHAGRAGYTSKTEGCVRTTENAMQALLDLHFRQNDPLTEFIVQNDSAPRLYPNSPAEQAAKEHLAELIRTLDALQEERDDLKEQTEGLTGFWNTLTGKNDQLESEVEYYDQVIDAIINKIETITNILTA